MTTSEERLQSHDLKQRVREVVGRLGRLYPGARTALHWDTPLDLLVAVILSAQCTDVKVNEVTESLFQVYRRVEDYAAADPTVLERQIRPTGFFRQKTKAIIGAAGKLVVDYQGKVPRTMDELLTLPGVARKTANIVLAEAYGVVAGIPVDTHVRRLTNRLGLTTNEDPVRIEEEMMAVVPRDRWYDFSSQLIYHGRQVCVARKPRCHECVLSDICPSAFKIDGQLRAVKNG